jgi:hypothetical protein
MNENLYFFAKPLAHLKVSRDESANGLGARTASIQSRIANLLESPRANELTCVNSPTFPVLDYPSYEEIFRANNKDRPMAVACEVMRGR